MAHQPAHHTVRSLLVDLSAPFERRWAGGDAFLTAFFNALSMSFPVGEQFFIDSVRAAAKALPADAQANFADEVQGFVGQEATHRRIHGLFNGQLEAQGHRNTWGPRAARRIARFEGGDPRHALAVTAGYEHFTAIMAAWMLQHPQQLDGAEPRLRTMWMWHAAEETEHRSTAFDVYRACGGNHRWRLRWFYVVTFFFVTDVMRQTLRNLWHDGALLQGNTWRSAWRLLFAKGGLVRDTFGPWRAYFRADFHPQQQDEPRAAAWLRDNAGQFREV